MRILFASSSSGSRGGGETFLVYLGAALAERGHEVILWTSSHPRMDEVAARFASSGRVIRAEYTNTYDRPRRSLGAVFDRHTPARAAKEWMAAQPDVIHINKQNLEDGLDLLRASGRASAPSLCTIHITQSAHFLKAKGAWLRDAVSRIALQSYKGMLATVSEPRKRDLAEFLDRPREITAIPNGVPIPPPISMAERESLRAELGLSPENLGVLAVGRMTAQKRPLLFLEIAAQIAAGLPNARFFWIGDGPLAGDWDARATALGIAGRCQRLGWRDDVAKLLPAGDLLLHTAEYEGMPFAILEAMAAGLPCAVSDSLHRELPFLDDSNSIRVSDERTLVEAMQDRASLSGRAAAARAVAEARFSTAAMAGAYEALYRRLGSATRLG